MKNKQLTVEIKEMLANQVAEEDKEKRISIKEMYANDIDPTTYYAVLKGDTKRIGINKLVEILNKQGVTVKIEIEFTKEI